MRQSYGPAVTIGIIAGVRSMAAPALVSRYLKDEDEVALGAVGRLLTASAVSRVLQASATAEFAADKSPRIPDRVAWPSLAWRAVTGGLAGSVVAGTSGRSRLLGGVLAAAAAVGAAYGTFYLRRTLNRRLHVPDRLLGAAEDSLVVGAGRRVLIAA